MWDFEHPPLAAALAERYSVRRMLPSQCAEELHRGGADLGLIPVAALTPDLAIVPGCTVASLDEVRSILLLIRRPHTCESIRSIAADVASRSSIAYVQVLLRKFHANDPLVSTCVADPVAMLRQADAAVVIGDAALLARERRAEIEAETGPLLWLDLAQEWRARTGLPWVAAVWAARPEALGEATVTPAQLIEDLGRSRDHGLQHIDDLVREWAPRIAIPPETIRQYLTANIHYTLDDLCLRGLEMFRSLAAETGTLPALGALRYVGTQAEV